MNTDTIKTYAISIAITFVSSFLSIVAVTLATVQPVDISSTTIAAIILAASRGALKAVLDKHIPVKLGGRKV